MDLAGIATVGIALVLACFAVTRGPNAQQWAIGLMVATPLFVGLYHVFKAAFVALGLMG